jgi:PAS domain S-box-containing protein
MNDRDLSYEQRHARLKTIAENVPGMLYQYEMLPDGTTRFPYVGRGSVDLVGLEPEEIVSDAKRLLQMVHHDDVEELRKSAFNSALTGEVWDYEGRFVLSSGETKWFRGVSKPEFLENGTVQWNGLMSDITCRKRAEFALAESEQRFRLSVDHAMDGMVAIDNDGRVREWNKQAQVIFGWTREEALERSFAGLVLLPEHEDAADEVLFRSLTHPEALGKRVVIRAFRRDGSSFPLEFAWSAVGYGLSTTFLAFLHDITERRLAEDLLNEAKEGAERSNRGKTEFLSRMSHEIRTPLNAILGFGQLLSLEDLGEESNESVTSILEAGRHLLDLINEVLDIARIEAGQISLNMEIVQPIQVMKEVRTLLQPIADQNGVALIVTLTERDSLVLADAQRLKQVLLNLVSNGIKYTRKNGMVGVRVSRDENRVLIHVEDDGPGIEPTQMERLFIPFDRLGADRTNVEGTGLGLPLTKTLVEAMGAEILVQSELGRGASFTVSFPKLNEYEGEIQDGTEAA